MVGGCMENLSSLSLFENSSKSSYSSCFADVYDQVKHSFRFKPVIHAEKKKSTFIKSSTLTVQISLSVTSSVRSGNSCWVPSEDNSMCFHHSHEHRMDTAQKGASNRRINNVAYHTVYHRNNTRS